VQRRVACQLLQVPLHVVVWTAITVGFTLALVVLMLH
jgi:hypothetical protein